MQLSRMHRVKEQRAFRGRPMQPGLKNCMLQHQARQRVRQPEQSHPEADQLQRQSL